MEIVRIKRAFTELGEMFSKTRDDIGAFFVYLFQTFSDCYVLDAFKMS